MKIKIKNYKKVKSAEIELAPAITLIDGKNGHGKTTILNAIKNVLQANANVAKSKAHTIPTTGAVSGSIEGNGLRINYPKLTIDGEPIESISAHSTEIRESVLLKSTKEAAMFFVKLLGASPTYDDFYNACDFIDESKRSKLIDPIWKQIKSIGWTNAEKNISADAKGKFKQWGDVTGERYGSAKAEGWKHPEYTPELDSTSENQLMTDLEDSKRIYESSIASSAVDEAKIAELEELVNQKESNTESNIKIAKKQEKLMCEINVLEQKHTDIQKEISLQNDLIQVNDTKLNNNKNHLICPHCKEPVTIINNKITEFKKLSREEIEGINDEIKEMQQKKDEKSSEIDNINKKLEKLKNELNNVREEIRSYQSEAKAIERAENELKKLQKIEKTEESPDHCMEIVKRNEARLTAYRATKQAKEIHEAYLFYKTMERIVSVEGVRRTKVADAVGKFNDIADKIFTLWSWRADSDFSAIDDLGRSYEDFSDGEKWCCRALYQVVSAILNKDKIVLIDVIEDVDRDRLTEFIKQVYPLNIKVVIARATDSKNKESIEIDKLDNCKRYTIVDGIIK